MEYIITISIFSENKSNDMDYYLIQFQPGRIDRRSMMQRFSTASGRCTYRISSGKMMTHDQGIVTTEGRHN